MTKTKPKVGKSEKDYQFYDDDDSSTLIFLIFYIILEKRYGNILSGNRRSKREKSKQATNRQKDLLHINNNQIIRRGSSKNYLLRFLLVKLDKCPRTEWTRPPACFPRTNRLIHLVG